MDELADLIGAPRDAVSPGVSRREERLRMLDRMTRENKAEREEDPASFDLADIHAGVTVGWLSKVFGMDPSTVKKRLAECPPLHRRKSGYVYSLPQAAAYLVKPVFNVHDYLKSMKPSELPSQLQKEYWDAALKRQRWEVNAAALWHTEDVRDTLAETFKTMKFTIQLWADSLEQQTGLTDEQRKVLEGMTDSLQRDLFQALVEQVKSRQTRSTAADITDIIGDSDA